MTDKHMRYTVGQISKGQWAIFHQSPPEKTETGMNHSLRFPSLIAWEYLNNPKETLEAVAQILNDYDQ